MLCICLNFLHVSTFLVTFQIYFTDWWSSVNSLLALCFGIVFVVLPVVASILMWLNFDILQNSEVKRLYGTYYEELNLDSGKKVIFYMFFFFIRRAVLVILVVFNNNRIAQIFVMELTIHINIILIVQTRPFTSGRFAAYTEIFNEIIIMLIMYTNLCFTNFVHDPVLRFNIGYVTITIVSIHLLLSLSLIVFQTVKRVIIKVKQIKYRLKLKAIKQKVGTLAEKRIKFGVSIRRKDIIQVQVLQNN